jgi:hypothetical protein
MDTFTLVASIVLLGFIAWVLARIIGGRDRVRRDGTGPDAGSDASWSTVPGGHRDPDHGMDSRPGDGGGGND